MYARDKRKHLVFSLYMDGFYPPEEMDTILDNYLLLMDGEHTSEDDEYIKERYHQVKDHLGELDKLINTNSDAWRTDRMDATVLAIMRVAVYEMLYDRSVPLSVSINEAVEMGKRYGGTGSYALINGILANIGDQLKKEEGKK